MANVKDKPASDAPKQEVTKPTSTAVAAYDYGDDAGKGFEGTTKDDFLIPMLDIVQSNGPEIAKGTMPDAKVGMLVIRTLSTLLDGAAGLPIIPCGSQHVYVEWVPREKGGGIAATYEITDPVVVKARNATKFGRITLENGNNLVETFYLYSIALLEGGNALRMVVPFTSTKIGPYRGMMTKADGVIIELADKRKIQPPLYAHQFLLKTFRVEKKGFTWFNYHNIDFNGDDAAGARIDPSSTLYKEAREFSQQILSGKVKVDTRGAVGDDAEQDEGGRKPIDPRDVGDEEVPF